MFFMEPDSDGLLEPLVEPVQDLFPQGKKCAFLAGAGVSVAPPSNLLPAREIARVLLEFCAPAEEVNALMALPGLRYEQVVEEIERHIDPDLKFMDYLDLAVSPNDNHLALAGAMLAGHPVLTTNFDYFIEHAAITINPGTWKERGQVIITKDDFTSLADEKKYPDSDIKCRLYKLHGSSKNLLSGKDTRASLVTTMKGLGRDRVKSETFAIEPYKKSAVISALAGHLLVVMGYSGRDDFDVTPLLREFTGITGIIWIEHVDGLHEPRAFRVRPIDKNQSNQGGSGNHRVLLALLASRGISTIVILCDTKTLSGTLRQLFKFPGKDVRPSTAALLPPFRDWVMPLFDGVVSTQKEMLASHLFRDHGENRGWRRAVTRGLDAATAAGNDRDKSCFLDQLAWLERMTGDVDKAILRLETALTIDEQLGDLPGKATRFNNIGFMLEGRGNIEGALQRYEQALAINEQLGNLSEKSVNLNNIGGLLQNRGDIDGALSRYEQALAISEQLGDLGSKAVDLTNIGTLLEGRGDFGGAMRRYEQALAITEQLGNLSGKAIRLNNIGFLLERRGDIDGAMQRYKQALAIDEQLGDLPSKAIRINNIGALLQNRGDIDGAMQRYEQMLAIDEQLGDLPDKAIRLNNIGFLLEGRGDIDGAMQRYEQALAIDEQIGDLCGKAIRLNNIGSLLQRRGDKNGALRRYEQALAITEQQGDLSRKASCLHNIGSLQYDKGKHAQALQCFEEALALYQRLGMHKDAADEVQWITLIKIALGKAAPGKKWLQKRK
jgi:tetratricopeptide (TPR) repeat protein